MKLFNLLLIILFSQNGKAFAPPAIDSNNDGIEKYRSENYQEAFNGFAGALSGDPFNPLYHFNLGDTFFKAGDYPKAFAEFEAAESQPSANPEIKYLSMFNAGNTALAAKDIPKALGYYQRALEYNPKSVETKTNIELALKEQQKQGGGGDSKDQKDKKDPKDQNKGDQDKDKDDDKGRQKPPGNQPTPKPTAQPFDSKALNENDVRRILEELKRQEQEIRAKQDKNKKNAPEKPVEKDW